jgi:hypothetical protein
MRAAIPSVFVVALALAPRTAFASACCGEGHGIGHRLTSAEAAAISGSVGVVDRIGSWSASGGYHSARGKVSDRELQVIIGWAARVTADTELGITAPILYTWRRLRTAAESSGGGVGDVTAFARHAFVPPEGRGWLPGIALTFAATAPTGRPASRAKDALGADATGLGVVELRPGLTLEKVWWRGWFASVAGSVGFRTASSDGGLEVARAPRWQVIAAAGPSWPSGLSIGVGALVEGESAPEIDGVTDPDAGRRKTTVLAHVAHDLDLGLTLVANARVDLPVTQLGKNEVAGVGGSIGLRFALARED